jgi:hypothetical protein
MWIGLEADSGVTGTTSVTAWADKSGNGNNLTSGGLNHPSLIASALNGNPVIDNNGNSAMGTSASLPALANATVYVVGKQFAGEGAYGVFVSSSGDNLWITRDSSNNGIVAESGTGSPFLGSIAPVSDNTFYTIRLRVDGTTNSLAINNGAEVTVSRDSAADIVANPLEVFDDSGLHGASKQIAAIYIFTEYHNSTKVGQMETYLKTKYAHY